jgi:PIN domain nuclease of toxin-antitoxin system
MIGDPRMQRKEISHSIRNAVKNYNVFVSAISLWELSMLDARGRIKFTENANEWMKKALSAPGIRLQPITPEIAYESAHLPGRFIGDPADRLIVSSARILNAELITFDREIIRYGQKGYVRTVTT